MSFTGPISPTWLTCSSVKHCHFRRMSCKRTQRSSVHLQMFAHRSPSTWGRDNPLQHQQTMNVNRIPLKWQEWFGKVSDFESPMYTSCKRHPSCFFLYLDKCWSFHLSFRLLFSLFHLTWKSKDAYRKSEAVIVSLFLKCLDSKCKTAKTHI